MPYMKHRLPYPNSRSNSEVEGQVVSPQLRKNSVSKLNKILETVIHNEMICHKQTYDFHASVQEDHNQGSEVR